MDHSVPSTEETGRTSSLLWRSELNRENNNSSETICVGPGERDGPLIRVLRIEAKIDNEPTQIDETSPAVLKYRTPNFRYQHGRNFYCKMWLLLCALFVYNLKKRGTSGSCSC